MFERPLSRLDDEKVILATIEHLMRNGLDRPRIEKALITYAPVDLDLLADCYVRALRTVGKEVGRGVSSAA